MKGSAGLQAHRFRNRAGGGAKIDTVSAAEAKAGRAYRVHAILGGCQARSRLAAMGILPGQDLKVLKSNTFDPIIISTKHGKLALGRGISHKLLLVPGKDERGRGNAGKKAEQ